MAHPFAEHKSLHKTRVGKMTHGYKSGGAAHSDEAQDRKLFGRMMREHEGKMDGAKSKSRADKYARGGKVKHKGKTHISINVMPQGAPQGQPMPAPMPGAPPAMPPHPPMMPPPGGPPGMPPGAMPPPGMPHARGGRAYKHGGAVKDGPTFREGIRNATKVQHTPDKDGKDIGRKPVITKKAGGAIFSEGKHSPVLSHAAGGGKGRLEKTRMQRKTYP